MNIPLNFFFILYPFVLMAIILISKKLSFLDKPNQRKVHNFEIPHTLGIGIYIFMFISIIQYEFSTELEMVISIGFFIILLGFIDDQVQMTAGIKLILKSIPIIYLIFNGLILNDLGNYEFIDTINLGKFSFAFLFLASLLLTNAYNYIDGIDGLLLSIAATSIAYFIFLSNSSSNHIFVFYYMLYAITIAFIFNVLPIKSTFKSFTGNAGSLFIGFFISFSMVYLYKFQNVHPAFLIWSCWLVVYDFLYVTINRIINKKRFDLADQSHLHHFLLKKFKKNHLLTCFYINLINILVIIVMYLITRYFGLIYSLILFLVTFFLYFKIRILLKNNKFVG